MRVFAKALVINGANMVVFGSYWPHTSSKKGNAPKAGPSEYHPQRNIYGLVTAPASLPMLTCILLWKIFEGTFF